MTTFQIPSGLKNLAPKDGTRYAIEGADIRPEPDSEGSALVSVTDGRALAVRLTEAENLGGRVLIPRDALPTGKREALAIRDGDGDRFLISSRGKPETVAVCPADGSFPPLDQVIPDPGQYRVVCRLNVDLLHKLAQALDPEGKSLAILCHADESQSVRKPLIVLGESETLGVIMPMNHTTGPPETVRARTRIESMRERIRRAFLDPEALRLENLERAKVLPAPIAEAA